MPKHPTPAQRDERVAIPLDPEDALRGLLALDPDRCPICGAPVTVTGGHVTGVGHHDGGVCSGKEAHWLHRVKGGRWTVPQSKKAPAE